MVAKKRSTLRSKARRQQGSEEISGVPETVVTDEKQLRKEKLLERLRDEKDGEFGGVSKSAVRRRKRKMRDDLKPKMGDLLASLEGAVEGQLVASGNGDDLKVVDDSRLTQFEEGQKKQVSLGQKRRNEPSIRTQKGSKLLAKTESARFGQVISNETFQQNPFGALRDIIKMQRH